MRVIRYIPTSPFLLPDEEARGKALELISAAYPDKEIEDGYSRLPQFVDSGDLLGRSWTARTGLSSWMPFSPITALRLLM